MNYTNEQLRKIDALVAERVMGAEVSDYDEIDGYYPVQRIGITLKTEDVPNYTTSISAAWEVVEKGKDFIEDISWSASDEKTQEYFCMIECPIEHEWITVSAPTAPLAISLAALKAKGIDVDKELGI